MTYRNTYAEIKLKNIKHNVKTIIKKYNNYKYYIGVVKADSYGHNSDKVINSIIDGGCNYLAVSSLDEALIVRKTTNLPILCLGIIDEKYMNICEENNIDITITNINQIKKIKDYKLNIHIKLDTGMNRLGIKSKEEFNEVYNLIKDSKAKIKGLYTHIYKAENKKTTNKQINKFKEITSDIDLSKIDIVHISQSSTLINHKKIPFCNGCRLGLIMYNLTDEENLKDTISLVSEIIEIKKIKKNETVSYDGKYKAKKDETIAIASIGYADGIDRKMTGAYVYINNKKYKIIGNICMDMLMIKVDETVKLKDKVYLYKDSNHIKYLSKYIKTIPYELICRISKRVVREYKN